jgi:predicted lipid-binding transport protein (Tim44 family)
MATTEIEAASLKGIRHANTVSGQGSRFYAGRAMAWLPPIIAQAGGGSSGFGGGGGGGGGGFGGGGSSGSGEGDPIVAVVVFGLFGIFLLYLAVHTVRYRRKLRQRDERVRTASAEAAEDDAYFAADELERHATALFRAAQTAWDARDREGLARLVGPDLLVEWNRRLDDFDRKGWHNRVEVLGDPAVLYVGITNRDDDTEDRAVVRVEAKLRAYVLDANGNKVMRTGEKDEFVALVEYWTLGRRDGQWIVQSIEQRAEGDHHLDEEIVASPWSDDQRLEDEALTELAAADALPEGFTTADLAEVGFEGDARAHALDLSVADARFAPDVLEAAARGAVGAWAEAVDGDDAALERVASPEAVGELLYGGDASRRTRLVVRGPRVKRIQIAAVHVEQVPATMTVELELGGRRYVEDRDTAAVLSGSKDAATTFKERWTLALAGPDDAPWRIVETF